MEEIQKKTEGTEESTQPRGKSAPVRDRRRLRYGGIATAVTLCVVAAVVLINVVVGALNDRFPLNFDLTADKLLTMTEQSEEFARSVQEPVQIVVFAEEETFLSPTSSNTEYNNLLLQFHRTLEQYRSLSDGRVTFSFVNLTEQPTEAAKYSSYGVVDNDILFLCGERSSVAKFSETFTYDEMAYYYYQQLVLKESRVEQVLALGIQRVVSGDLPKVTLLVGHGEEDSLKTALRNVLGGLGYTFEEKNITTTQEFPEGSTVAVIAAPNSDYTEEEIKDLRSWVDNNGNRGRQVLYFPNYRTACPNLNGYFQDEFGIQITRNLVCETSASRVPTNYRSFQGLVAYADVADSEFTKAAERGMVLSYCLQLGTTWGSDSETSQYAQVIATLPESAKVYDIDTLMKAYDDQKNTAENGDAAEAAAPELSDANAYPLPAILRSVSSAYHDKTTVSAQAVVFGSSNFLQLDKAGDAVFVSLVDGISGNENSVNMPTKMLTAARAEFKDQKTANLLGLGVFTIALPLVLVAVAIVVFVKRKRL